MRILVDATPGEIIEGYRNPDLVSGWRHRIAAALAILLWLLTWLGGWWLSSMLAAGSMLVTMIGAFVGWALGLGVATLVLYLDERV